MTPEIKEELEKEEPTMLHEALLTHVKTLVKASRCQVSKHYADWDYQDMVFRGEKEPDASDKDNDRKGRPIKMSIPNTFAQCMTATSFWFLMFNQNKTFFELSPSGDEDHGSKRKDCETVLQRDLRVNAWNLGLFQHLLDITRFGVGVLDVSWTKVMSRVHVAPPPQIVNINGVETAITPPSAWQEFTKFEGNLVRNISPYRFGWDTTFPLTEMHRGQHVWTEEEYTMSDLYDLELSGEVAGVKFIEPLPNNMKDARGAVTRHGLDAVFVADRKFDPQNPTHKALVTKCQVKIVPSKFKIDGDTPMGPEDFPVLYHIWYANDNRLIRAEPCGVWHNEFSLCVAQFTPDMQRTINLGLADLIYRIQDLISWYVNSHVSSVRRVMQNRLIIDPRIVDTKTLDGEGDIYLRKGVSVPPERGVSQLKVQDVTGGHMSDVDMLGKIMELVTGVNGNAMGQYNSGRRSAQEARVVTAGAAGRMKLHAHLIWESSLGRMGKLMLSNSRQALSQGSFRWATGETDLDARYALFKGTPEEIVCGDDFMVFDSTLSSEKGFMAQSLSELLQAVLSSSPMAAQRIGMTLDPMKMLDEIQYLRGAGNVSRFALPPEAQQQQMAMLMAQQQNVNPAQPQNAA